MLRQHKSRPTRGLSLARRCPPAAEAANGSWSVAHITTAAGASTRSFGEVTSLEIALTEALPDVIVFDSRRLPAAVHEHQSDPRLNLVSGATRDLARLVWME